MKTLETKEKKTEIAEKQENLISRKWWSRYLSEFQERSSGNKPRLQLHVTHFATREEVTPCRRYLLQSTRHTIQAQDT